MPQAAAGPIETDALIVGAGPVGLFQVFELGLLDIRAHVVDALPYPGGQCVELYADKPIYDLPAIKVCTGQELTDRLLAQIAPFGPVFHFGQEVAAIQKATDGRFHVQTSRASKFLARTVFIAAGVGAFQPRALTLDGIEKFEGRQLHYRVSNPAEFVGKDMAIIGGDDHALDRVLDFCAGNANGFPHKARSVVLIHRRDVFKAAPSSVARMRALCEAGQMQFIAGQPTGYEERDGRLAALHLIGPDGLERRVALDALLVLLGLSPKLGPIAHWGLDMERKQLLVNTENFSTSVPGIFAVGDIITYPGKKKLILCGFHECTLAAFGAAPIVFPDRKVLLQYTTTSPGLHKLLGVETPTRD
jgi:thioredoxin reductase (NADPH)